MAKPKAPTRRQLAQYFKDQDTLIRFQQLFEAVGTTLPGVIETTTIGSDISNTNSIQALAQIEELKVELEFLAQAINTC